MAPLLLGPLTGSPEARAPGDLTTITAQVTLAADAWFEICVLQVPGLVLHASSLEQANQTVLNAVAEATGKAPAELRIQLQW